MWISSTSSPNLSLIVPPTMEIYYRTGFTENRYRHTCKLNLIRSPFRIGSSKKQAILNGKRKVLSLTSWHLDD